MHRYFLALPLPDDAKDRLVAVQPPALPGIRIIGREELHVTLHFLGEVAPRLDNIVPRALAKLKENAFTISIRGIGRFANGQQPLVLWAGVEPSPALFVLRDSIATVLTEAIGFQAEGRPYSPHVTLARFNGPAPPGVVEHYLEANKNFQVPSVLLKQFALYSSRFVNEIPQYQQEAVFDLL